MQDEDEDALSEMNDGDMARLGEEVGDIGTVQVLRSVDMGCNEALDARSRESTTM